MNNNKKGIIVFIVVCMIILLGYGKNTGTMVKEMIRYEKEWLQGTSDFQETKEKISKTLSEKLAYHHQLLDAYSYINRISQIPYITKDDSYIVKMKNGYLNNMMGYLDDTTLDNSIACLKKLSDYTEEKGGHFLYVACPQKGYDTPYPDGIENAIGSNNDRFYQKLKDNQIPKLILREKMQEQSIPDEDIFFITDHHWTPEAGFWASGEIVKELKQKYDFSYKEDYITKDNYTFTTYEDYSLGSLGKKTGRYYSELGLDDFTCITPNFNTSFTHEKPYENSVIEGDYSETLFYPNQLASDDLYAKDSYGAYGGDSRFQVITNHLAENEKKVLIIRDSYTCVLLPFLAMQFKQIYAVDTRSYTYLIGERRSIYDMIEEIEPDYVMVIYPDVPTTSELGRLDFE